MGSFKKTKQEHGDSFPCPVRQALGATHRATIYRKPDLPSQPGVAPRLLDRESIPLFSRNCSGRFSAITSTDHLWCGDQSGLHSPLCGSGSRDAPSAQGTVRTPFADSRVRPHSLGSVGKVRINARSLPPNSRPGTSPTPTGSRRRSIIDRSDVGRMVFSGTNQPLPPQIQFPGSPAPQSGFGRDRKKPSPPFTPTLNHSSFLGRIPKKLAVLKRLEGPRQHATVRASIPCSTILSSLPPLRRPLPPRTALLATSTTKPRSRLRPTRCWASRTLLG